MNPISLLYGTCALGYVACSLAMLAHRQPGRTDLALALACAATAAWAGLCAVYPVPQLAGTASLAELFMMAGWYGFGLLLYRRLVRPVRNSLPGRGAFEIVGVIIAAIILAIVFAPAVVEASLTSVWVDARLGIAMAILLILENLYRNVTDEGRWHVNMFCVAIAGTTLFGVLLCADAVVHRHISRSLYEGQALAYLLVVPLFVLGARRNRRWAQDRIVVSQSVVFQSATLLVSGIFLIALAAAGEVFRRYGSGWGRVAEVSVIFSGLVTLVVLISSGSFRSKVRSVLVNNFSAKRYDYRLEWMNCIQILSGDGPHVPLHLRVIRAIANVVDSPSGMLFLAKQGPSAQSAPRAFEPAGAWNMPEQNVTVAGDHPLIHALQGGNEIAVAGPEAPPWLPEVANAWLAAPLNRTGVLIGFVLLAQPRAAFNLDREVFDLLRIIGREVSVFISEQKATTALVQARQFEEAGRRFSFVAHDIKNVASQLSLLLSNADRNMDNPEFRRDMMTTLRSSVQKIGAMVARLRAPSAGKPLAIVSPRSRIDAAVEAAYSVGKVRIALVADDRDGKVAMEESSLDAVIRHLVDNAIEASGADGTVQVRLQHSESDVIIEVADQGRGMSPAFVRDKLFQPFASSKKGGLGIGAFQARELVREVGGEIEVFSVIDKGTTMRIALPLVVGAAEGTVVSTEK